MRAARERHAAVEAEQFAAFVDQIEIVVGWLLLHDHRDVLQQLGELRGKRVERLFDEALELARRNQHGRSVKGEE
jgi:hypothetical protein